MSGNGHHNTPLGSRIKTEVLSALRLLFKTLRSYEINTRLEAVLTIYQTEIPCLKIQVDFQYPSPAISLDPIKSLTSQQCQQTAVVLKPTVVMGEFQKGVIPPPVVKSCEWKPVSCVEPVLNDLVLTVQSFPVDGFGMSNESPPTLTLPRKGGGDFPPPLTRDFPNLTRDFPPLVNRNDIKSPPPLRGRVRVGGVSPFSEEFSIKGIQGQKPWPSGRIPPLLSIIGKQGFQGIKNIPSFSGSRFQSLPIRKSPLSPQRFSLSVREQFRQALAEKNKTIPANIQLKQIYASMQMTAYSSIRFDETGDLLCIPKREQKEKAENQAEVAWLIVGTRLDTQESLKTLIPISALQTAEKVIEGQNTKTKEAS